MAQFSGTAEGSSGRHRPGLYEWDSGVPGRMIADVVGWVEAGLIVVASVVAKYAYIVVVLGQNAQTEPYLLAGLAGACCSVTSSGIADLMSRWSCNMAHNVDPCLARYCSLSSP